MTQGEIAFMMEQNGEQCAPGVTAVGGVLATIGIKTGNLTTYNFPRQFEAKLFPDGEYTLDG